MKEKLSVTKGRENFGFAHARGHDTHGFKSTFNRFHNEQNTIKGFAISKNNEQKLIQAQKEYLKASHMPWSAGKSIEQFKTMNAYQ